MTWTEREHRLRTRHRRRRGAAALGASLLVHGLAATGILLREPPPLPRLHPMPRQRPTILFLPREQPAPPLPEPPLQSAKLEPPAVEPPPARPPIRPPVPPPEKKKPEEPPDPFADLPALWWQRETTVSVMDRLRRGVVAVDSLRVPLVRLEPASRELATALLNDHFHELRPWLRAEAAKEALRERFPYLGE